ncbi:hypothetical protein [Desulfosarcina sp.]|uniref:hypothetical protein n=1 Tax=Desulfosarcina sp. TaxID=2027861 RepID=UPI0029B76440|nr:hypothetical protein [Desulfosarcina sp.]MDX2453928.1 hypothetical protein [Desulfosarcina sp.]MDX2491622.1 hypothetical protein [Desulfosarcina sp.]
MDAKAFLKKILFFYRNRPGMVSRFFRMVNGQVDTKLLPNDVASPGNRGDQRGNTEDYGAVVFNKQNRGNPILSCTGDLAHDIADPITTGWR